MGFISWIRGKIMNIFQSRATQTFRVHPLTSSGMEAEISRWLATYRGNPDWLAQDIDTINFSQTVSAEIARLTCLDISVTISGSRGEALQDDINLSLMPRLQSWVEYGAASGTIILKPNGAGIDILTPDRFMVTSFDSNKEITGAIFIDTYEEGSFYYTKLEYQRFEGNIYKITNKVYRSSNKYDIGMDIPITSSRWAGIEPEVSITKSDGTKLEAPLFGVFRTPGANNIDLDSPLGVSAFASSMQELKSLDTAYSRFSQEIYDSQDISLIDERLLHSPGEKVGKNNVKLPRYVKNIFQMTGEEAVKDIKRELRTEERTDGINALLSLIGTKCGFGEGYFVLDRKTALPTTAREIESGDRKTIDLIKSYRDNLQKAISHVVYAMNIFMDLYDQTPAGDYQIEYNFADLTYSADEDRARCYQLAEAGYIPKWYYLTKWEGFTEQEAKKMLEEAEAETSAPGLFSGMTEE